MGWALRLGQGGNKVFIGLVRWWRPRGGPPRGEQTSNMSGTLQEKMNYTHDVTFFGRFCEDFKKMLRSWSRMVTYRDCFRTYPFVLFKVTIWCMSGRIYKFTRNFHAPYGAHKPVSRDSYRRSQMMEHASCLKAQCADFMDSLSCKCRTIVMCSVNIRGQAWRAFQIEGGRGRVQSQGRYG